MIIRPRARVEFGQRATITGHLKTSDGRALGGATVQLLRARTVRPSSSWKR